MFANYCGDLIGIEQNYAVKIESKKFALGARNHRGYKRRHKSSTDKFKSVQIIE